MCELREEAMNGDFWLRLGLAALIIIGIFTLFSRGMLFGRLGDLIEEWLGEFEAKPIVGCMPCMSSFWGSMIWFLSGGDLWCWIPFVLALCGLMRLVSENLIRSK